MKRTQSKSQTKKATVKAGSPATKRKLEAKAQSRSSGAAMTRKSKTSPEGATTKHDKILALLRAAKGASIKELVDATKWQSHSVRGFLAGVVRKKLGLILDSEKIDGLRRYRIGKP